MKNPEANNNFTLVVSSITFAILSDIVDKQIYTKILTAIMILVLIFVIIRNLKFTLYHIKNENPNIQTFISVKIDYWLLFIRNLVLYGFLASLFFITVYDNGYTMWFSILALVIFFILFIIVISKFEDKTDIINNEENHTD
ncbi:hypothetical protein ACW5YJ_13800 [Staphylococcus sp. mip270_02]|uniref:DUF443 domain-containing protein n=1 Tax=Staphylococcus xylosus TaxID=1288 RepID=A0A418IL84_STAXY|nr:MULTISPECIES: hypothetical protein [Staphylococcus]MBF0813123.1 hypothetical protein [Staphylococcus saprophyticus]MDW8543835.1 hypothetical protein [Staphylococcus sp. KG4-1]MRF37700.1 hypothetical protein [Staphylococcus sp. KY49P]MDW8561424.1 hypothetical protein [Staphylococcus sp. KG4-3]PTI10843.1 hypothetical protein BU096_00190 [Staphylococcus xylosus]